MFPTNISNHVHASSFCLVNLLLIWGGSDDVNFLRIVQKLCVRSSLFFICRILFFLRGVVNLRRSQISDRTLFDIVPALWV